VVVFAVVAVVAVVAGAGAGAATLVIVVVVVGVDQRPHPPLVRLTWFHNSVVKQRQKKKERNQQATKISLSAPKRRLKQGGRLMNAAKVTGRGDESQTQNRPHPGNKTDSANAEQKDKHKQPTATKQQRQKTKKQPSVFKNFTASSSSSCQPNELHNAGWHARSAVRSSYRLLLLARRACQWSAPPACEGCMHVLNLYCMILYTAKVCFK